MGSFFVWCFVSLPLLFPFPFRGPAPVGAGLQIVSPMLCNTTIKYFGLGKISVQSLCNIHSRLKYAYFMPTYTVPMLNRIFCERLV